MTISLLTFLWCGTITFPDDSATASPVVDVGMGADTLEYLVEQLENVDESSILDVADDLLTPAVVMRLVESRSRLSRKLQPSRGFMSGRYLGSSVKSYQRLKFTPYESVEGGVLFEKDPGESKLNDFTAGYLQVRNLAPLHSVLLGDFVVEAGQGIALWRGYDFSKGVDVVMPVRRKARGLVPYRSSEENAFLRGVATSLTWQKLSFLTFFSRKSLSATIDSSGRVSTIYADGYFRTRTEREKRNIVSETLGGLHGLYHFSRKDQIGLTVYVAGYSRELPAIGENVRVVSSNYEYSYRSIHLFGEWSWKNSLVGGISGIHVRSARTVDVVVAFRDYPAGFYDLHNSGFRERSSTSNERGWYFGIQSRLHHGIRLSVYYDLFSSPQKTSTTLFASRGNEVFAQVTITPFPRLDITPRVRSKLTVERRSVEDEFSRRIRFDDEKRKTTYRTTVDYRLNRTTMLRTRFEYADVHLRYLKRREHGMMNYSDLVVKPTANLSINGRIAVFRTESFDSGIAEYERDLPGVLTVPILYGNGSKWYLLVQYSPIEDLRLSVKYSELIRDDVKTIGSGWDEIMVNRDNRLGIQIDASF